MRKCLGILLFILLGGCLAQASEKIYPFNRVGAPEAVQQQKRQVFTASWLASTSRYQVGKEFMHRADHRKSFVLPAGKVWNAQVDISGTSRFWVNGRELPFVKMWLYDIRPVDLAPYLKPGQENVVAISGERLANEVTPNYDTFIFVQGSVVMADGTRISLDSVANNGWVGHEYPPEGWTRPGFDARNWQPSQVQGIGGSYLPERPPIDTGYLLVDNPNASKLFFDVSRPVMVQVRCPVGLAAQNPTLEWSLARVAYQPEKTPLSEGREQKFAKQGDSLLFTLHLGKLQRGIYTLGLRLVAGEKVLQELPDEPLAVIGKLPMKEVEGSFYEQGMKLVLEDTIDFTNPQDPHPWVETRTSADDIQGRKSPAQNITQPSIAFRKELAYRQAGPVMGSMFSYGFRIKSPGSFYLFSLEYPDDAERAIAIGVQMGADNIFTSSQAAPAVRTGERYPLSGQMKEFKWLMCPDAVPLTIDIITERTGAPAAAARVKIYRVDELPALQVNPAGERLFGVHTERAWVYMRTFGDREEPPRCEINIPATDLRLRLAQRLLYNLETAERYCAYLRFAGQNLHVMGCVQYDWGNIGYDPPVPGSRVPLDHRDMLVAVASHNGIHVQGGIEYRQGSKSLFDSEMREEMALMVKEISEKFADQPSYDGICFQMHPADLGPAFIARPNDPLGSGYDDRTIAAFENDTGIEVAPTDPAERMKFLTSDVMRERWLAWRCQAVRRLLLSLRDEMRQVRPDLQLFVMIYFDMTHVQEWARNPAGLRDYLRGFGYDPQLYLKDDGIYIGRYYHSSLRYWQMHNQTGYQAGWGYNVSPQAFALYDNPAHRAAYPLVHFHEMLYRAPGVQLERRPIRQDQTAPEWPWLASLGPFYSMPEGDYARETFIQSFIGQDPDVLIYGWCDSTLIVGHEQALRQFARNFVSLPRAKMSVVKESGLDSNLAVRELASQKGYYFSVANPGPYVVKGEVVFSQDPGKVISLPSGKPQQVTAGGGGYAISLELPPFGLETFQASSTRVRVKEMKATSASGPGLDWMNNQVVLVEQALVRPEVSQALSLDDLKFVQDSAASAKADLAAGQYARAWQTLSDWRLLRLDREVMSKAGEVRAWLVNGPYPYNGTKTSFEKVWPMENDLLQEGPDQTKSYDGLSLEGKPGKAVWLKVIPGRWGAYDNFVDLDSRLAPLDNVLAYAFSYVYSPVARKATVSVGSDDGCRVWIGGKLVIDHWEARAAKPAQDQTVIDLPKGWTAILIKVEERIGGWGFFFDLLGEDGKPLADLQWRADKPPGLGTNFTFDFDGLVLRDLTYRGERIGSFLLDGCYFASTNEQGGYRGLRFTGLPTPTVKKEDGSLIYRYDGQPTNWVRLSQEYRFSQNQMEIRVGYQTLKDLVVRGGYMPMFRLAFSSSRFLGLGEAKVAVFNQAGEKMSEQQIPAQPEKPVNLNYAVRPGSSITGIRLQSEAGALSVTLDHIPDQNSACTLSIKAEPGQPPILMLDLRTDYPKPARRLPAGTSGQFRILFSFGT